MIPQWYHRRSMLLVLQRIKMNSNFFSFFSVRCFVVSLTVAKYNWLFSFLSHQLVKSCLPFCITVHSSSLLRARRSDIWGDFWGWLTDALSLPAASPYSPLRVRMKKVDCKKVIVGPTREWSKTLPVMMLFTWACATANSARKRHSGRAHGVIVNPRILMSRLEKHSVVAYYLLFW